MTEIEYFYAGYSAFAYLGSAELYRIARDASAKIRHRPMDLRAVVAKAGVIPPQERSQTHKDYYFGREIERWAEHRKVPIRPGMPTYHHHDITLSNCLLIAADEAEADIARLSHEMLRAHWLEDADLDNPEELAKIATAAGLDPAPLLSAARTPEIRAIYQRNTEEAIARSVFGSPTYFVEGDMFYGQDRLELVARALQTPYRGQWPR